MTLEQGKPLAQSHNELSVAAEVIEWFAGEALVNVPTDARVMNEEPFFGPLAIINRVRDVDEGLAEAKRSQYDLTSYAYTTSTATAYVLRSSIAAGMLTTNHLGLGLPEVPFGGVRDSGYGQEGDSEVLRN